MKTLLAAGKYVVVKKVKEEQKAPGSLILPDSANTDQEIYEIVSMGEDTRETLYYIDIEHHVVIKKYAGQDVKLGDDLFKIVHQDDILAIIDCTDVEN